MTRGALLFGLLLILSLVAPAAASPQPSPVCAYCSSSFEDGADEHGIAASVGESTVDVHVHENGSATWVVRNRLETGADAFRESPEKISRVGDGLQSRNGGLASNAEFVSATVDGDTAVLVYRDPAAVDRHAGVLVVDYLHDDGNEPWYVINADRFTIHAPEGSLVTNSPDSGLVDEASVTWNGDSSSGYPSSSATVDGSPYVVFGPDTSSETSSVRPPRSPSLPSRSSSMDSRRSSFRRRWRLESYSGISSGECGAGHGRSIRPS